MIISEFAKYLQEHNDKLLTRKTTPLKLLHEWLKQVINKNPKTNIDKIVHREILYCENQNGDYLIVGKSDSGRVLVSALIKFAKTYTRTKIPWSKRFGILFCKIHVPILAKNWIRWRIPNCSCANFSQKKKETKI